MFAREPPIDAGRALADGVLDVQQVHDGETGHEISFWQNGSAFQLHLTPLAARAVATDCALAVCTPTQVAAGAARPLGSVRARRRGAAPTAPHKLRTRAR